MRSKLLLTLASFLLTAAWIIPLHAQDAQAAKTFLESVYRQYGDNGKGPNLFGPKAEIFHSSLLRLMHADEKANGPGQVGALDGDPVCSCQDWDGIYDLKIEIQPPVGGKTTASVSFALNPKERTSRDLRKLTISLASEHGQWRIYDILDHSKPDHPFALRAELQKDITSLSHTSNSNSAR